jgi:O-antigen/teichoic acid export membrane protein
MASIFVARVLGKVSFGELGIVQSSVSLFGTFAGFGLGLTATKHIAEFRTTDQAKVGRVIGLSSVVSWITGAVAAALLFILAPWLATHTLAAPHLSSLLRIASLLLLLSAINGAQTGALAGFEAFRRIARINLIAGLTAFPLMVGGACWRGLEGAVFGLVANQTVNCILSHCALRRETCRTGIVVNYGGSEKERDILWSFSLPAVLSGIMVGPANWLCNALIVNQPNGYGEMGIFAAANQWRNAILFLPSMLASVCLPMLANLRKAPDRQSYRKILRMNLTLSFLSTLAVAVPVSAFGRTIMAGYGSSFVSGSTVLVILCGVSVIGASLNVIGQTIASEGRMWFGFVLNAVWAAILLAACFVLRERGAIGLALANLAAYSVHLITVSVYVHWRMQTTLSGAT